MKVKVGDIIYDGKDQPVMVILSDKDKKNIGNMIDETKYCAYPEGWSEEDIDNFMKIEE